MRRGKETKKQTLTRHKEPLRRWLTNRPVSCLSFRARAKARVSASVRPSRHRRGTEIPFPCSLFSLPNAKAVGKERIRRSERVGWTREMERPGSESGAYISAGTNCPIIHSVRRQCCSSAYPRPLLPSPTMACRIPSTPPGFCLAFHKPW